MARNCSLRLSKGPAAASSNCRLARFGTISSAEFIGAFPYLGAATNFSRCIAALLRLFRGDTSKTNSRSRWRGCGAICAELSANNSSRGKSRFNCSCSLKKKTVKPESKHEFKFWIRRRPREFGDRYQRGDCDLQFEYPLYNWS